MIGVDPQRFQLQSPPEWPEITDPDIVIAREAVCRSHHDKHPESPWHRDRAEEVRAGRRDYGIDVIAAYEAVKMMRQPAKPRCIIRQDGFIRHTPGDECPVPPWTRVQVQIFLPPLGRPLLHYLNMPAGKWPSIGYGWDNRIVAYKIVR
jgi:hypothetical protein